MNAKGTTPWGVREMHVRPSRSACVPDQSRHQCGLLSLIALIEPPHDRVNRATSGFAGGLERRLILDCFWGVFLPCFR